MRRQKRNYAREMRKSIYRLAWAMEDFITILPLRRYFRRVKKARRKAQK